MAQAVRTLQAPTTQPHSLRAQLDLAIARESLRRTGAHDRLPALMARKAFREATKLLAETAERCK